MRTGAGKFLKQLLAVMLVVMMSLSSPVIAQTTIPDPSRPISGVIAATKAPVTISYTCLLYTSPSPRDLSTSRMPSSA